MTEIKPEWVEAAILAALNAGRVNVGLEPADSLVGFIGAEGWRAEMRTALAAVLPEIVQAAKAEALRAAADAIDLEDAAKQSDLNDLDYYWTGHYWESVTEEWLRARAGKTERGES